MMNKKLSNSQIDSYLQKNKPNIIRIGNYINRISKIDFKCEVCSNVWNTSFASIHNSKMACPTCASISLTKEYVNMKLKKFHIQLIDNVSNTISQHKFQCENCNYSWSKRLHNMIYSLEPKCPKCIGIKNNHIISYTNEHLDKFLEDNNTKIIRKEDFKSSHDKIDFQCTVCSFIWKNRPVYMVCKKNGCPKCKNVAQLTNEIVDERLKKYNVKRLTDYVNSRTTMEFNCLECNHNWKTRRPIHTINGRNGCPLCNIPKSSEKLIISSLKDLELNFKFNYCLRHIDKNEKSLFRVDFYFPANNLIIEYNGAQHYNASTCFGNCTKENAQIRLEKQKARDKYVDDFCKSKNIRLIWIDGRKYVKDKLKVYLKELLKENKLI